MTTTELVVEMRPEKNSGPYGIWTHDLCGTSAALYQLSQQANWKLVLMSDSNKPSKWWMMTGDIWKSVIIYKNYLLDRNFQFLYLRV